MNELISFLQSKQKKSFLKPKQIVSLYGQRGVAQDGGSVQWKQEGVDLYERQVKTRNWYAGKEKKRKKMNH